MPQSIFLSPKPGSEPIEMDLSTVLLDIRTRSVAAYARRQQLEQQRQMLHQQTLACDQELIMLDGEERAITALQTKAG